MKNYSCNSCHYFKVNTVLNANSGECHRHAPNGADASGFSNGLQMVNEYQAGIVSDSILSEVPVYLYKNNFELLDEASPLPIAKGMVGLNSNEIIPFFCRWASCVAQIKLRASLANVGAGTKGSDVKLKIVIVACSTSSSTIVETIEIDMQEQQIGIFGNTIDGNVSTTATINPLLPINSNFFGFWIELDDTNSENYIAEIRNPQIAIRVMDNREVTRPFSLIEDKTVNWCGEFKRFNSSTIENCWQCDYFDPANIGVNNSGHCRKNAPRKFDQAAIPDPNQPGETSIDFTNLFPFLEDATTTFCGDFKRSTSTIPIPV